MFKFRNLKIVEITTYNGCYLLIYDVYTKLRNLYFTNTELLFDAGSELKREYQLNKNYKLFEVHVILSNNPDSVSHQQYRNSFKSEYMFNDNYHTLGMIGLTIKYNSNTNILSIASAGNIFNNSSSRYLIYGIY